MPVIRDLKINQVPFPIELSKAAMTIRWHYYHHRTYVAFRRSIGLLLRFLLLILLVVRDLLFALLLDRQPDGIANELAVLLHHLLQALLLGVLRLVLLQVDDDLGAAAEVLFGRRPHREAAAGKRLPRVLFVVVVLAVHDDAVSD